MLLVNTYSPAEDLNGQALFYNGASYYRDEYCLEILFEYESKADWLTQYSYYQEITK